MADPRVEKLAETLVNYSVAVQPGDWVVVRGHVLALPLEEATVRHVTLAGGNPTVLLDAEELDEAFLQAASEAQLNWPSPVDDLLSANVAARIVIRAASNTRTLTGVDPRKQQLIQKTRRTFMQRYMERTAAGTHNWVLTQFPCPAYA